MKVYLEPISFLFLFSNTDAGKIIRKIFRKAEEGKITIVTSIWSYNQYLDEMVFLYRDADEDAKFNVRVMMNILGRKLSALAEKNHYVEVGLTQILLESASLHIINSGLTAEQAVHMFSAQLNRVNIFVVADESFLLDKDRWKDDFDVFHLQNSDDRLELEKILKEM